MVEHTSSAALEAGLAEVARSPTDDGQVELIVRRPAVGERESVARATLDLVDGLVADTWRERGSSRTDDGSAHPGMQLTLMNARVAALVAGPIAAWPLAGDQLYVDLDLSEDNLPPGCRLVVGSATIEVTDQPHLGCAKFRSRFGRDALQLVNSPVGRSLRLRGANARILVSGTLRVGDAIGKPLP